MNGIPAQSRLRDTFTSAALVAAMALIALLVWETVAWMFDLPKALLPTPRQCLAAAIDQRDTLLRGTLATGIAGGVALAATAGLISAWRMLRQPPNALMRAVD